MKSKRSIVNAVVFLATSLLGHSQIVLVDGPLLNGGFDDTPIPPDAEDRATFAETASWVNLSNQGREATRTNIKKNDGSTNRSGVLFEGTIATGQYHAIDTAYDLVAGDAIEVSFEWRDAFNWDDATDYVAVDFFTTVDNLITGERTVFGTLETPLSTVNNTWEDFSGRTELVDGALEGSRLFASFRPVDGNADPSGFGRLDNFKLSVIGDPQIGIQAGDFDFGDLFHETNASTSTKTVTFTNAGATQDLTVDDITLTDDAGMIYSITAKPTTDPPLVVAPGGTFEVEITATGGGGFTDYAGVLQIDATPDSQDTSYPVSANISTTGDPFYLLTNSGFESGLDGWSGSAVATDGIVSGGGARVPGIGDDRVDTQLEIEASLEQSFAPKAFSKFDLDFALAVPDMEAFLGDAPVEEDRSFHLSIMANADPSDVGVGDDILINLFYFPAGDLTTGEGGFYVFNRETDAYQHLPDLGMMTGSTDFNEDGTPPNTLNVHRVRIEGRNFGSPSASYSISMTDANSDNFTRTQTGLTAFHGADATERTVSGVKFLTNDPFGSETNADGSWQSSFWLDDVVATLADSTIPIAFFGGEAAAGFPKFLPGMSKALFTVTPSGEADLVVSEVTLSSPEFSLVSPELPVSIAPGGSQEFVVNVGEEATPGTLTGTATLVTTDADVTEHVLDLSAKVFASNTVALVDYDDGIANGIHEASVRNGGFEEGVDGQSVDDTPSWSTKANGGTSTEQLTYAADPATGLLRGRTGSWRNPGAPNIAVHDLLPEDWTIEEGDSFTIEFKWKPEDPAQDLGISMNAVMMVRAEDGTLITDVPQRPIQQEYLTSQTDTYNLATYTTTPVDSAAVPHEANWIGKGFRFMVEHNDSPVNIFSLIDDMSVTANFRTGTETPETRITSFAFDPVTKNVTLRWVDEGGSYSIEANDDLNFTSPTLIPLDGSETVTDGIYEYLFNDPGATGPERFWRIAD